LFLNEIALRKRSFKISECEEYSKQSKINPYPSFGFVGGVTTNVNEFPHMTAIGLREGIDINWFCGASLISDDFIITAAHCVPKSYRFEKLVARIGDKNLQNSSDGANPQEFGVKQIRIHPEYKNGIKYHDISLIQLDRKAL
jgi:secreted trypsin-like serine protease